MLQTLDEVGVNVAPSDAPVDRSQPSPQRRLRVTPAAHAEQGSLWPIDPVTGGLSLALVCLVLAILAGLFQRRSVPAAVASDLRLTEAQRQIALEQVRAWIQGTQGDAGPEGPAGLRARGGSSA